jgi:hypothetical protein
MSLKCRSWFTRIFPSLLLLVAMLTGIAFAGDPDQDADGDRDHPTEREQWFLHGRSVEGRPGMALL